MSRLYLKVYATIIAMLVVFIGLAALLWQLAYERNRTPINYDVISELTGALLPGADAPLVEQQRTLDELHRKLRFDLALHRPDGVPIVSAGRAAQPFDPATARTGWRRGRGGPAFTLQLADGRWLVARVARERTHPAIWLAVFLGVVAIAVAVGAYPVVRGLTGRLERLREGVDRLGGGDLAARVPVEGRDEVAALARSVNASAARIEELVAAHRLLLANCSHELRAPLARIAMVAGSMRDDADPALRAGLRQDVAELNRLIDGILLSSRLDAVRTAERPENLDLLALAAEEAAPFEADVTGTPVSVTGERLLLRRLVRNLLENAQRYGGPGPIEVAVTSDGARARLSVSDRGPGVPESERERIFEPFHRLAGSHEDGRGSGLGLALVRQIARRHGGDVRCERSASGGSVFLVDLPAG